MAACRIKACVNIQPMNEDTLNAQLLELIRHSPTPFHACAQLKKNLLDAGFTELKEAESWQLSAAGRYFVSRNDSSVIAFSLGQSALPETGLRMVGAHTDSPCLHVKPEPDLCNHDYYQLGVEVYGGALLNPWFDRDLSIAGRVSFRDRSQQLGSALIDFERAIACVPSLAIHLDRDANKSRSINKQKHLPPILLSGQDGKVRLRDLLLQQLKRQHPDLDPEAVLDFELSLYDCQPPALTGLEQDFIASARLDNLLSCHVGLRALLDSGSDLPTLLICNDHEEVGSKSACGANGPFLKSVLQRLVGDSESLARCIDRSWMVSADNAHGIHPNYADKHDANHGPLLNQGPVIKVNSNQRYATNSDSAALFRHLCEQSGVPVQSFVVRSDMGCGSTIGPITASNIGVKTIDVGVPTFAMHSIREMAGAKDTTYLYQALKAFFSHQ